MRFWVRTLKIRDLHEPNQLKEIATAVHDGLKLLGETVAHEQIPISGWQHAEVRANWLTDERQIIIGGNVGTETTLKTIPDGSVVYNFEQYGSFHFTPSYLGLLRRCEVWDYNHTNISKLWTMYGIEARYVPFGYVPSLTEEYRKEWDTEEYDVMFVGSMCVGPRKEIIKRLKDARLKVFVSEACYGTQRAEMYQRSKLVLNMHYHPQKIMETVRCGTAMANHKAVVCQMDIDTQPDALLVPGMACVPYQDLVTTCLRLAHNDGERARIARLGFELFSSRKMDEVLRPIIADPVKRTVNVPQSYERAPNPSGASFRRISRAGQVR